MTFQLHKYVWDHLNRDSGSVLASLLEQIKTTKDDDLIICRKIYGIGINHKSVTLKY